MCFEISDHKLKGLADVRFKVWMMSGDNKQISCHRMADRIGTRRRCRNCANQSKENFRAIRLRLKLFASLNSATCMDSEETFHFQEILKGTTSCKL